VLNAPSTSSKYLTNVSCPVTTTSLNKVEKTSNLSFQLYPNPSKGKIQLEVENLGAQTTYEIISLNGVEISQDRIQNRITTINIDNFPSGMYLLNLMNNKSSERIRFIVL